MGINNFKKVHMVGVAQAERLGFESLIMTMGAGDVYGTSDFLVSGT